MSPLPETVDGLPNLSGSEDLIERTIAAARDRPVFLDDSRIPFDRIRSACAIALHMHQPLTPTGGDDLRTAALIGNLQTMLEHPGIGDNHNAPAFRHCYARMGEFIPALLAEGHEPRVMLEYSGTLLHGLRLMGADDVIDSLKRITSVPDYRRAVEWLGAPWGHAVAPSTPVQDFRLHVRAWQHHFAAIFGLDALARVRGFSPSEMALPNHPEVAYEFVRTLLDCGYRWVLVQEHTVEEPGTGAPPRHPHRPHRLVCRNAAGETASIVAIVKTQGSDTKLVAQMQPWYEAQGLQRGDLAGTPRAAARHPDCRRRERRRDDERVSVQVHRSGARGLRRRRATDERDRVPRASVRQRRPSVRSAGPSSPCSRAGSGLACSRATASIAWPA